MRATSSGAAAPWVIAAALLTLLVSLPASAGLRETFTAGNEAFWSGDFDGAIGAYEELVELGVWDADLFHNLGTAYARAGRLGPAVLNFERALSIDPGHLGSRENLDTVRRALARRRTSSGEDTNLEPPRSFWLNLLSRVTAGQVTIPFIIFWVGLFLVLGVRRVTDKEVAKLALLIVALLLAGGVVAGGALVLGKASYDAEVREAIVIAEGEAVLREGPGERFRLGFEATEGDRLRILDREGEWLHLRDDEGQEGWGTTQSFGEIRRGR